MLAMIFGYIFEIQVFRTYFLNEIRVGYKGIYSNSGQTSIYFILMLMYYAHQLIFKLFNKWNLIKFFIVALFSLLIGTKTIFFFLPLFLVYYLVFLKGYKKKYTFIGVLLISLLYISNYRALNDKVFGQVSYFYQIYLESGFLSSFTSYRNDLFLDIVKNNVAHFVNYLIGGVDFSVKRSEMAFIDLWLFFGPIGLYLYLYFYKVLFNFKFTHHFYWFIILSLSLTIFFADEFVLNANVPILLFLISSYFYLHETRNSKSE